MTLPPCSTAPAVSGCRLVGYRVVSGLSLYSSDVSGVSQRVSAPARRQTRGRVPSAGWSLDGVGPDRGLWRRERVVYWYSIQ